MSALSGIISTLESGGNPAAGGAGTITGQYQQSYGFQQQYGGNNTGSSIKDPSYQEQTLHNYAGQVLAANPNATLGDFYSGYVLNTGNPANLPGTGALQSRYPAAYNNLVNNAGVSPDTPLSSLLNGGGPQLASGPDVAEGYGSAAAGGDTLTVDPNYSGGGGNSLDSGLAAPAARAAAGQGGTGKQIDIGAQPGLVATATGWVNSIIQGFTGVFQRAIGAAFSAVGNWFVRGFLILIGIVLLYVALRSVLTGGEGQSRVNVAVAGGPRELRHAARATPALEAAEIAA